MLRTLGVEEPGFQQLSWHKLVQYHTRLSVESETIWRRHVNQLRSRHTETDSNEARENVREEDTPIPVLPDSDRDSVASGVAATQPVQPVEDSSPSTGAFGSSTMLSTTAPCRNPPRTRKPPDHYKR